MSFRHKLNRRNFLSASAQTLLSFGAFGALPKELRAQLAISNHDLVRTEGFSVLQGLTTQDFTQLTVDVPLDMLLRYELKDLDTDRVIVGAPTRVERPHSSWAVDRLGFSELELGHTYEFLVRDLKGEILDRRQLNTLDLEKPNARLGVLSCMWDRAMDKPERWRSFFDARPDMAFFIGDTVYGDMGLSQPGPEMLWRRYIETRRALPFYHSRKLTPCLAVWDDHDYGKNNEDHNYPHKVDSLATFETFFAQDVQSDAFSRGPGVSSMFKAFGQEFMFLDNRYYRGSLVDGEKSFWGKEQIDWFQERLFRSSSSAWLLQGSQFFGGYSVKNESYEKNYEVDFQRFKDLMRSASRPTLLVAGDVHFSEIMEIEAEQFGYKTHELTSSSMHSMPRLSPIQKNPRRTHAEGGHNHLVVDIVPTTSGSHYRVSCLGKSNTVNFSTEITI